MNRSLARRNIYKMLSFFFRYPEESNRSLIIDGKWRQNLRESLNILDEKYFEDSFEDFSNECSKDRIASQQDMAIEYRQLFGDSLSGISDAASYIDDLWSILPEKERPATGFSFGHSIGSHEIDREADGGVICEKAELNVQKFELMAILAEMESRAICGARIRLEEIQLDFLSRFMVPDVPDFCEEMIRRSTLDFYRTLGVITREFVKFEENYLGIPEDMDTS